MHALRVGVVITIAFALTACGGGAKTGNVTDAALLAWPPSDSLSRAASDDAPYLRGSDAAQSGGAAAPLGNAMVLGPSANLSWAVYSLQGFGPDVVLDKLELDFAVLPGNPDQGTALYVGLANYATERWEWFDATAPQLVLEPADFDDYYSPGGSVHVACVLGGNGSVRVFGVRFSRIGDGAQVPVPENLQAQAFPGSISLSWDAVPFVDGYNIYRGLSNDFGAALKRNTAPITTLLFNDISVVKNTDYHYWVAALRGSESAPSVAVAITAADTTLAAPQNLQATASVGAVQLTWDASPGASSYRVQRSRYADFSSVANTSTTNTSHYDNSMSPTAQIYYYRVVALGIEESPPSAGLSIFVPTADLPAPENFAVDEAGSDGDFVILSWDYDNNPAGFNIYFHRDPDFALDGDLFRQTSVAGTKRQHTEFGLPAQGGTFYCRICARDADGNLGRMSAAISFTNNPALIFAPQEDIGASATYPVPIASDGTDIAAAYFSAGNVRVAQRSSGTWSVDQNVSLNGSFEGYLDITAGNDQFMVAALQSAAGDCWVSIGSDATWTTTRIHGDDDTGDDHPVSGLYVAATAGDSEFAVTHALQGSPLSVLVQTRPFSGGAWSETTALSSASSLLDLSLAHLGSDLFLGVSDYDGGDLLVGSRDGGFSMAAINETPGDFICGNHALGVSQGQLLTPAADLNDPALHVYRDIAGNWLRESILPGLSSIGRVDMATHDDKVIVTFFVPSQSRWYYAYYDGSAWSFSSILTVPADRQPLSELRVVFLSTGEPYIVFEDNSSSPGALRGAPGYFL